MSGSHARVTTVQQEALADLAHRSPLVQRAVRDAVSGIELDRLLERHGERRPMARAQLEDALRRLRGR